MAASRCCEKNDALNRYRLMTVQFNHTIVPARNAELSAQFLADLLGRPAPTRYGPFYCVALDHGVTLDFMDTAGDVDVRHFAFLVGETEFDAIFGRIRISRLAHRETDQIMTKLRVHNFAISLDGYGAGPHQDLDNPLGVGGEALHDWIVPTRSFQQMCGNEGGERGVDDDFVARGFTNIGAWILGRNMFGPIRGSWPDNTWKGWWGDNPPYHTPVFVLTRHPRPSITMDGGTIFHFVTDGIHAALQRATDAAKGQDVRLGGGVAAIRQYLQAGLIDEMHVGISPILLGSGEHLVAGIDTLALGYRCTEHVTTANAMHFILKKRVG